ncbi:hypothetical protein AaE_007475 [Aphanomyces astaci]|uniref:Myb/SANT-like domain-containing protein n=1 Tax=Aphanomyces astaci TaxID=112090 RepID=A0A6A5AAI6_APHAT|nr:hypothetical protein AaE_007475 [Aphanomyces astaci]
MEDTRASWTEEKDSTWMVEMIYQSKVLGKSSHSGFKREAWLAALVKLNREHKVNYSMQQLKARHAEMKKQYAQAVQIIKTSGVSFETTTSRFICLEGSWSHFLLGKPSKWALWQTKRFPQFKHCQELYDGTLATGEFALSTIEPPTQPSVQDSDQTEPWNEGFDLNGDDDDLPQGLPFALNSQDINDNENQLSEDEQPKKKKSRSSAGDMPVKKGSKSVGAAMISELKELRQSGKADVALLIEGLTGGKTKERCPVEVATDALQDDFDDILDGEEMSFAYEVIEDPAKATQFVRMRGESREIWLRRHIRIKMSKHAIHE